MEYGCLMWNLVGLRSSLTTSRTLASKIGLLKPLPVHWVMRRFGTSVGDAHNSMEELREGMSTDPNQDSLEESESLRQVKEEWTRLQVEADGLKIQLMQDAGEIREGTTVAQGQKMARGLETKRVGQIQWQNVRTLPRSRLPSLDSVKDTVSTFPSINLRSSLRKNILEGRHGERLLDIQTDLKEQEPPQQVTLSKTAFYFGSDTPTQTDIKWSPPANAELFKLLLYDIEVDGGQGWTALTESRLPILRVYFTSEKIIMGRFSRVQQSEPVGVRLRIRAVEKTVRQGEEDALRGPWSEEIWLTLEGSQITCNTAV